MGTSKQSSSLRRVYDGAKERCNNKNHISFQNYGGRGIEFRFNSFTEFLDELGPRPVGYSLDRINNDGHYEVGNVRWSSLKDQALNRNNLKGVVAVIGVSIRQPSGNHKNIRYLARTSNREVLYCGPDLFEAICRRKSWEKSNIE